MKKRLILLSAICIMVFITSNSLASEIGWAEHNINSSSANSIHASDFDRDNDTDVVGAVGNRIFWYENNGVDNWVTRAVGSTFTSLKSVYTADINADNFTDIVSGTLEFTGGGGTMRWHQNNGASPPSWTTRTISTTFPSFGNFIHAKDVNNDGKIDVLGGAYNAPLGAISWHDNNGTSPWTTRTIVGSGQPGHNDVHAADFDRDNDTDVVAAFGTGTIGRIYWYDNNGSNPPGWTERSIDTSISLNYAYAINPADIDGDNDTDVVAAEKQGSSNLIAWYENDGGSPPGSPWTRRTISSISSTPNSESIYAIDIDNDGDIDVLNSANLTWYENDGASPPSWTSHLIAVSGSLSVYSIDMDKDGDKDIVTNSIKWYESDLAQSVKFVNFTVLQVVEDVDFVKGKTTLARAKIKNTGNTSEQVTVKLFFNGTNIENKTETIASNSTENFDFFFIPNITGNNREVKAELTYTNSSSLSVRKEFVNIVQTRDLSLYFVPVNDAEFNVVVDRNVNFLEDIYPVRDNGVNDVRDNSPIDAAESNPSILNLAAIRYEILNRAFLSGQKFTNAIGVVPAGYLYSLDPPSTGINFRLGEPDVILVDENQLKTVSHEVGHTFELCDEYDPDEWHDQDTGFFGLSSNLCPNGDLDNNNSLDSDCLLNDGCPTSTLPELYSNYGNINESTTLRNIMGSSDPPNFGTSPISNFESWISEDSYNALLNRLDVNSSFKNPVITYVNHPFSYIVTRIFFESNGSFTILDSYQLNGGFVNNASIGQGNYTLQILDNSNHIISNISFQPNFIISSENGTSIQTNESFVILALPTNESFYKIRIRNMTSLLQEINKTTNSPTISINQLQGAFSNELFNISWNSSDLDGDSLNHTIILLRKDDGVNITLGFDISNKSFIINSSNLEDCENCSLKLIATDGINTNYTISSYFSINNDLFINDFKGVYHNNTEIIFKFKLNNTLIDHTIGNLSWTLDTGQTVINSDSLFNISLASAEEALVFVYYNYTSHGSYNVTAVAYNNQFSERRSISIVI